jgi:ERCC4-type nuclease
VQLLRRLRDEAHRFAISFHRKKRSDRMRRSRLSEIPGLGQHRQKELLAAFRSIDYIREASPEQLAAVPGIGPRLAQQIYEYFHPRLSLLFFNCPLLRSLVTFAKGRKTESSHRPRCSLTYGCRG